MAGARPRAGDLRALLSRVAARLTTPPMYLGVLGGLQIGLLWMLRSHYGSWLPLAATGGLLALLATVLWVDGRWQLKLWGAAGLGVLTAIGPTLLSLLARPRVGLTMEHDGLLQVESAIDRVLNGQPIYGVDWSNTPMASFPWDLTPGTNPALHHLAYYPLTVLIGVPIRLVTAAAGWPFDYRLVLIIFALVGLVAILSLPVAADRRFLLVTAIYASPLITLYLWPGRNDIEFLAMIFCCLALLGRNHPALAGGALGVAVALKPFAWVAIPFYLLVLLVRWRTGQARGQLVASLTALALVPAATILPFLIANPTAFWADTVLYASGGVPDAYPIAGYGLAEALYELHLIAHRTDSFPFGMVQLMALVPTVWLTARAFLRRPTLGRWIAGYAMALLAFTFFARFFNDNYAGVVITLFLCAPALADVPLVRLSAEQPVRLAA